MNVNNNVNAKVNVRIGNSSVPGNTNFFTVCWRNGGGKIRSRLNSNPELRTFLKNTPNPFTYVESETPSPVA